MSIAALFLLFVLPALPSFVILQFEGIFLDGTRHGLVGQDQLTNQVAKGLFDVFSRVGAHHKKLALVLLFQFINCWLDPGHFLLQFLGAQQVGFVGQHHLRNLFPAVEGQLFEPVSGVLEGLLAGDVEYNTGGFGQIEIIVNDSPVAFLPGRVPKFEIDGLAFVDDLLEAVVDADGRFLGVELSLNVAQEEGALANSRPPDDDGLEIADALVFLSHFDYKNLSPPLFKLQFLIMIRYSPSSSKALLFLLLTFFYSLTLYFLVRSYFSHYLLIWATLVLLTFLAVGRAVGTFLMFPGSFLYTRAEVELRESDLMLQGLRDCLLGVDSILEKIKTWNLDSLYRQKHCLNPYNLLDDLMNYNRIIQRRKTHSKIKQAFEQFENQLRFPISSHDQRNPFTFYLLLQDFKNIERLANLEEARIIADNIKLLTRQIWFLSVKIMSPHGDTQLEEMRHKHVTAKWQLFGEKLFELDSFFIYWDNLFNYTEYQIKTPDGKILQCAIIHSEKGLSNNQTTNKAVLICNPNGAFVQTMGLSSGYIRFYLKEGYQVVLWNYRGYAGSTGTPSITNSIQDSKLVYRATINKFKVEITVVHGYSIGGTCAIHLAHQYPESIKLLVADRTFSRIDLVASGFIPKVTCMKLVNKVSSWIVKMLFYSDCVNNARIYSKVKCAKTCIWATYDEIIAERSSLRYGLLKRVNKVQHIPNANDESMETGDSLDVSMQKRQIIRKPSNGKIQEVKSLSKSFASILTAMNSQDHEIYRRFGGQMRRISGGGISMPCYLNITVDEFALRHRNYCLGLICFGPSEYSSRSEMLEAVSNCTVRIREEASLIANELLREQLSQLAQILELINNFLDQHFWDLRRTFGKLIVTGSGHNGDLQNLRELSEMLRAGALGAI